MATNRYGSIVSESVQLSFGFIGEFNLKRSSENGLEHWGKAIYCDPPQYFPDIQYYWVNPQVFKTLKKIEFPNTKFVDRFAMYSLIL